MSLATALLTPILGDASPWTPQRLFVLGEAGGVYDPSDLTAEKVAWALANPGFTSAQFLAAFPTHGLYQDAAGTTPVTALGQPVGLVIDSKTGGLANLGATVIANGNFASGASWTAGTGWSIGSGVATKTAGTASVLSQAVTLTIPGTYRLVYTMTRSAGTLTPRLTGGTTVNATARTASGTYTEYVTTVTGNTTFEFSADASFAGTVDDVAFQLVPGVHAIQASDPSRPLLDARVNLLTGTTTLATQSVTTGAAAYQLQFSGAGTVTLSGTATGTLSAGTHAVTTTAGTLTLTVSGTVSNADLRLAADAAYPYQRVVTATDYADVGVPRSFLFDGMDDSLYTASNMDLSGTDKVTVLAGVRKLSDAALGIVAELTNNDFRQFSVQAPPSASARYRFSSTGATTTTSATSAASYAAPITNVLTGQGDINAPSVALRVNAVADGASTLSQGGGNYASSLLYIGRRGNSVSPFSGKVYQLIVRGALTDAATLAQAERYVGARTGIFI